MKPIPQTIEAVRQLSIDTDVDVLEGLQLMADRVQEVVPDCMGLSIAWIEQGVTFTLQASDEEIAVLDAVQYLDYGPCVQAAEEESGLESSSSDLMDEGRWQVFARNGCACRPDNLDVPVDPRRCCGRQRESLRSIRNGLRGAP